STFLVKRFDRTSGGGRMAFVSAMTLTQRRDGEPGASYLELVELLQRQGADTLGDTHQLFRRIVFSILSTILTITYGTTGSLSRIAGFDSRRRMTSIPR